MKNIIRLIALAAVCSGMSLGGCQGKNDANKNNVKLTSISISPHNTTIDAVGLTRQFAATGAYSDATTTDITSQVTWSSQNESIATVNANGLATATGAGQTAITATSEGLSSSATLTVLNDVIVTAIDVTPKTYCMYPHSTRQYTATASLSNSQTKDVTNQAAWSSSDTAVVTINSTGFASSTGSWGTATITAIYSNASGTAKVTICVE